MNLQQASIWLDRPHVGFSDIHQFSAQCREAATASGRESTALVLLAQKATAFCERYEGMAVSSSIMDEFLTELREGAKALSDASAASDAAFLEALNAFASKLATTIVV
ncbi:hypothetical protein [Paraburkholderia xenovorans]|uniref:hypothetical protein n=1 Tax=Paraburkholderia xenovorans TaxID=36873 RepID=UPI0015C53E00|nr:hypothetical protein [Paraburkholderia xenovorans]NPT34957.1 hypothetical protein [Paraburkholderia xenovorans]